MSAPKLAAAAVAALMLIGWSFRSFVVDDNSTSAASNGVAAAAGDGPTQNASSGVERPVAEEMVRGVPVGYPQSRAGAWTAGVNWVASFPQLMKLNPLSLQNALVELMSEQGAVTFVDDAVEDYFALIDEMGPGFRDRIWIESPLQSTVQSWTDTTASIGVWSVVVTGGEDDSAVVALWRTHRVDLVWERDDWKIAEVVVAEGPTPITSEFVLPSGPGDFVEINAWQPAVFADTIRSDD